MSDNPEDLDLERLERDVTSHRLERFVGGDDDALPTAYTNLLEARRLAEEKVKRYLQWIDACDALIPAVLKKAGVVE